MNLRHATAALLLFVASVVVPHGAHAAEGYDNCTGFIDAVPATISTQGVWCLRHDLSTNIASGNAIEIAANNVTIDCNDFKLGGLAAGNASLAIGIFADGRQNATVRRCNIRGFYAGMLLNGGAGHLVEDNRLDNNLSNGLVVLADHSLVRRNRVFDTGGLAGGNSATGILAYADIVDNTVDGVSTAGSTSQVTGIFAGVNSTQIGSNRIRGLALTNGVGTAYGIQLLGSNAVTVSRNRIVAAASVLNGTGIKGSDATFCTGNIVARFSTAMESCLVTVPDNNMSG